MASLRQTQLDPSRRRARRTVIVAMLVVVGLIVFELLLERHRAVSEYSRYHDWHMLIGEEEGMFVVVVLAIIATSLGLALRFGLVWSIVASIVSLFGSLLVAAGIGLAHLLSEVERNAHAGLAMFGCAPLAALAIALFVSELVLRANQRADDRTSGLPEARVI